MSTGALCLQRKVHVVLLAGFHSQQQPFAFLHFKIAGIGVDGVFGINPVAVFFQQPLHAVGFTAFLVRRQGQNKIAGGRPAFFLETNQVGDQFGVTLFDVAGTAAIEEAVNLIELEWIQIIGPVLFQGLHHVQVAQEENRLGVSSTSAESYHQIVLVGLRACHVNIIIGKTCGAEACSHGVSRRGDVAGG